VELKSVALLNILGVGMRNNHFKNLWWGLWSTSRRN